MVPRIIYVASSLTILEAIVQLTTSRLPRRGISLVTASSTLVCLVSIHPEMKWTSYFPVETTQRRSINQDGNELVTRFTLTYTTSGTLYGESLWRYATALLAAISDLIFIHRSPAVSNSWRI